MKISICCLLLFALFFSVLPSVPAASMLPPGSAAAVHGNSADGSLAQMRIVATLQRERNVLATKRKTLDEKELALKTLQVEVDKKLAQMKTLSASLQKLLQQRDAAEGKRMEALSTIYEKMDPTQGAKILETLDQRLAIRILARMRSQFASAILANMSEKKAAALSVGLSRLNSH